MPETPSVPNLTLIQGLSGPTLMMPQAINQIKNWHANFFVVWLVALVARESQKWLHPSDAWSNETKLHILECNLCLSLSLSFSFSLSLSLSLSLSVAKTRYLAGFCSLCFCISVFPRLKRLNFGPSNKTHLKHFLFSTSLKKRKHLKSKKCNEIIFTRKHYW